MNKEIKLRKRRFWAICFVIVFAMILSIPSSVLAAAYSTHGEGSEMTLNTTVLKPGDVINYKYYYWNANTASIYYCDADANKTPIDSESYSNYSNPNSSMQSFTEKDYMGNELSAEDFKEWKVEEIKGSSDCLVSIRLVAVSKYTRSTITYVLNGGTNADSNPDSYNEGKTEVILADAEKEGCTFEGWYNDADFTTRVTSIPTTQRGPVVLYAKFTANNYNIFYELDGGSNGEGNPDSYTYGIGVASFADAEKEGYTFEGWYADAEFTTQITSIDATRIGDVTLHAKFVEDEEETTTEEETTSSDTTSNSEQPKTGDSSQWFLWAVLLLVSSCGMIGTAVYGKKKKMN